MASTQIHASPQAYQQHFSQRRLVHITLCLAVWPDQRCPDRPLVAHTTIQPYVAVRAKVTTRGMSKKHQHLRDLVQGLPVIHWMPERRTKIRHRAWTDVRSRQRPTGYIRYICSISHSFTFLIKTFSDKKNTPFLPAVSFSRDTSETPSRLVRHHNHNITYQSWQRAFNQL